MNKFNRRTFYSNIITVLGTYKSENNRRSFKCRTYYITVRFTVSGPILSKFKLAIKHRFFSSLILSFDKYGP